MREKKLIAVLLAFVLCLSLTFVNAQGDTQLIVSPTSDEQLSDLAEIQLAVEAGQEVAAVLDGEEIASFISNGDDKIALSKALSVGNHTLNVVAVGDNTSAQTVNFTIIKSVDSVGLDDSFNDGVATAVAAYAQVLTVGTNAAGNDVKFAYETFPGKDDNETTKGAIGFYVNEDVATVTLKPGNAAFYMIKDMANANWTSVVEMEYDLKMFKKGVFEIETKNKDGNWGYFGGKEFIQADGKVKGSDFDYPVGEWMHVKHIIDVANETESLYINDNPLLVNVAVSNVKKVSQVKLQMYARAGEGAKGGYGCAIDNLYIAHKLKSEGIGTVKYNDGNGMYVDANDDVIPVNTKNLMFSVPVPTMKDITDEKIALSKVKIYANGSELALKTASVDADGNVLVELSDYLPAICDLKAEVISDMPDGGTFTMEKSFKTRALSFGITDVSFLADGSNCLSAKQFKAGTQVKADFTLTNTESTAKKGVLVITAYEGNRLVALDAKEIDVMANVPIYFDDLSVDLPSEGQGFTAEAYLFDSFASRLALSKVWKMK